MIRFWLGYFSDSFCNIDTHHLLICCVTNAFTAAKFFLTIFSCFYKHWTWLRRISLTKYYYHVTCQYQNESTLYSCLNVKELLARNRPHIWSLSDNNGIRTHNQLVRKRTLNHCSFTNKVVVGSNPVAVTPVSLFIFQFLTAERDWMFIPIQILNSKKKKMFYIWGWNTFSNKLNFEI